MLKRTLIIWAGAVALTLHTSGCATAVGPYNQPSHHKVRLDPLQPGLWAVRVSDATYPLSQEGSVAFDVPRLERTCTTRFLGIKVREQNPDDLPLIQITKDGRTVKKLSIRKLENLPLDQQGFRLVKPPPHP
jgi:hypothetical protein